MSAPHQGSGANEARLAAALAEFLDRQAREECPSAEAFLLEHPELADELRPMLAALTAIDEATASAGEMPEAVPATLSGLRVLSEIGSGGMGRVLLAEDERLGRKVAIKTLHPRYAGNPGLRERFMGEARAMARLSHPNIVRIYGLGGDHEPPHFVMEYLDGVPLTEAARTLEFRQKAEVLHQVLQAISFLHERQMIHRDLKPGNILVGRDLSPKLLDFGLALDSGEAGRRLTQAGQLVGTPDYAAPEQIAAAPLDCRTDIFSVGTILYELLTGALPFPAGAAQEQARAIRECDPVLPRRINPAVPEELQSVCLKALEKDPARRYPSAREMAADLERYLAGEPALALPSSYSRMLAGKVEQHLREVEGWRGDGTLNAAEHDALRKAYGRLIEREDAWILESRRLSFHQVCLYLGGWLLVVGAALLALMHYPALHGVRAVALSGGVLAATAWVGMKWWRRAQHRVAMAFLLALCLLLPVTLLIAMGEYGWLAAARLGREDWELFSRLPSFRRISNAQLWWAIAVSLPAYYWLRRFTRSAVFSLVMAGFAALGCGATLLRMGLLEWLDNDPGRPYFYLIPCAAGFLAAGLVLERRRLAGDSRYVYPFFVAFTYVALTGLAAFHEPYAEWLRSVAPWTRGQREYLFLLNAVVYLVLQKVFEAPASAQMRNVAKAFRFVIPGHVLIPLLGLGLAATTWWEAIPAAPDRRFEARLFEILLPLAAGAFVFGSIPKQMKNFFVSGMLFLAIGVVRLQQDLFKGRALWPTCLLMAGLAMMLAVARYSLLRMQILRRLRRS